MLILYKSWVQADENVVAFQVVVGGVNFDISVTFDQKHPASEVRKH